MFIIHHFNCRACNRSSPLQGEHYQVQIISALSSKKPYSSTLNDQFVLGTFHSKPLNIMNPTPNLTKSDMRWSFLEVRAAVCTLAEPVWRWRWRGSHGPSSRCSRATSCSWSILLPAPPPCNSHTDAPQCPILRMDHMKQIFFFFLN